jgi:hypothetical protein
MLIKSPHLLIAPDGVDCKLAFNKKKLTYVLQHKTGKREVWFVL